LDFKNSNVEVLMASEFVSLNVILPNVVVRWIQLLWRNDDFQMLK